MANTHHILVVDDDVEILRLTKRFLTQYGFRISFAENAAQVQEMLDNWAIDLVVLDVLLPGTDGFQICRTIRQKSSVPIIMLTAVQDEADRILGLELGADDYLTKPFNPRELLARIRAVLRRFSDIANGRSADLRLARFNGWQFDVGTMELRSPDDSLVPLSRGEFALLVAFVEHPMRALSREQLADLVQGREPGVFDRSIDIQVSRLRRKMEADPGNPALIKTVRNVGYQFCADVDAE